MRSRRGFCASVLFFVALTVSAPPPGVQAGHLVATSFGSDAEAVEFLLHADVLSIEPIPTGVTKPRKLLLERDGVRAYAVFRDVDTTIDRVRLDDGTFHMKLRDSALFEVAAYRLAVLLGFDNVPPTVIRSVRNTTGSLQLWVDDAMTEGERRKQGLPVPNRQEWLHQMRLMSLFDTIIANVDRNPGNYLHAAGGKLWFIDHTRAFQMFPDNWSPRRIAFCDRVIWERLRVVDDGTLHDLLGDVLQPSEIRKLAGRMEQVVAHIEEQIALRGEREVILQAPGLSAAVPPATPA